MRSFVLALIFSLTPFVATAECTKELSVDGVIGPGVLDYLERGEDKAKESKCSSILLLINTPGGNLQTTRLIVEKILNSDVPYLCLVYPSGGHAGSAGAIILQACHISGAMKSTNIGAATPIMGTGQDMQEDLRKKMINDTVSWVEGLVKRRGRSKEFGKEIITEAKAVEAEEALKIGGIDFVVNSKEEFLEKASEKEVEMSGGEMTKVAVGSIQVFKPDTRYKLLEILTDPQWAYMIFMGSLALIYFELTHPGTLLPGVVGALGLVVSLISFHKLDVSWGGLILLLLGMIFLIAEAFVPSFGVLGIGGIVAFVVGSIFLFDGNSYDYDLPLGTVLPTAIGFGLLMYMVARAAWKTRQVKQTHGDDSVLGEIGEVVAVDSGHSDRGKALVSGSYWTVRANEDLAIGKEIKVTKVDGLTLEVSLLKED